MSTNSSSPFQASVFMQYISICFWEKFLPASFIHPHYPITYFLLLFQPLNGSADLYSVSTVLLGFLFVCFFGYFEWTWSIDFKLLQLPTGHTECTLAHIIQVSGIVLDGCSTIHPEVKAYDLHYCVIFILIKPFNELLCPVENTTPIRINVSP